MKTALTPIVRAWRIPSWQRALKAYRQTDRQAPGQQVQLPTIIHDQLLCVGDCTINLEIPIAQCYLAETATPLYLPGN